MPPALPIETAAEMIRLHDAGVPRAEIGRRLGMSVSSVDGYTSVVHYAWAPEARRLHDEGVMTADIARQLGVSDAAVSRVVRTMIARRMAGSAPAAAVPASRAEPLRDRVMNALRRNGVYASIGQLAVDAADGEAPDPDAVTTIVRSLANQGLARFSEKARIIMEIRATAAAHVRTSTVSPAVAAEIGSLRAAGLSRPEVAAMTGVSEGMVKRYESDAAVERSRERIRAEEPSAEAVEGDGLVTTYEDDAAGGDAFAGALDFPDPYAGRRKTDPEPARTPATRPLHRGAIPLEVAAEAIRLHRAGLSRAETARRLGLSSSTVETYLSEPHYPWASDALRMYHEGARQYEIARQLGVSDAAVSRVVRAAQARRLADEAPAPKSAEAPASNEARPPDTKALPDSRGRTGPFSLRHLVPDHDLPGLIAEFEAEAKHRGIELPPRMPEVSVRALENHLSAPWPELSRVRESLAAWAADGERRAKLEEAAAMLAEADPEAAAQLRGRAQRTAVPPLPVEEEYARFVDEARRLIDQG